MVILSSVFLPCVHIVFLLSGGHGFKVSDTLIMILLVPYSWIPRVQNWEMILFMKYKGTVEMTSQLRFFALEEGLGIDPSTNLEVQSHL